MMTEVRLCDAVGKRLANYQSSFVCNQFVLVFDDNTFAVIEGNADRDGEVFVGAGGHLKTLDFGNNLLIESGICTQKELTELGRARDGACAAHQEKMDRQVYEILRAKFEGKKP